MSLYMPCNKPTFPLTVLSLIVGTNVAQIKENYLNPKTTLLAVRDVTYTCSNCGEPPTKQPGNKASYWYELMEAICQFIK